MGYPVKEETPTPIQFKNTVVGKTIRTFFQTCAAVLTAIPALVAMPEVRTLFTKNPKLSILLVLLPALSAFYTAVQNGLDPTVPNTVKSKA